MQQKLPNKVKTKQKIRQFIGAKSPVVIQDKLLDTDSLLDNNIIDSMGFLDLVTFVESEFDIVVEDDELLTDNFDSIESITEFVNTKIFA
ncbi:MAG: acyl carrier protein [Waterburya sp.]